MTVYTSHFWTELPQRVQNAAARIVCHAPCTTPTSLSSVDLLKDLHWIPMRGRVDYTRLQSSVIKPLNCNNLRILLSLLSSWHSRFLR